MRRTGIVGRGVLLLLGLLSTPLHTQGTGHRLGATDRLASERLKLSSGFTARLRPRSEFSARASSLLLARSTTADSNVLNARDFGAVGDGVSDDAPALQRAITAAQHSRKILAIPAGVYLVISTLKSKYLKVHKPTLLLVISRTFLTDCL